MDRRTNAIAAAVDRPFVDVPEAPAPPPSRRGKRARKPVPVRPIADQILDLVQEEPRSGAELCELIGSPRSSVNQAVHLLEERNKVDVVRQPAGRGSTLFVFRKGFKNPSSWVLAKLGYVGVRG